MTGTTIGSFLGEITNHLWQSTVFALATALLTLACRKNRAQVRYWLWLSASLKFLIPFALLMSVGNAVWGAVAFRRFTADFAAPVSLKLMQVARPFPAVAFSPAAPQTGNWLPVTLVAIWLAGFSAIVVMRVRDWLRLRAAVRGGTPIDIGASVEVRSSPDLLEPGVVGFLHSILLLPQGILQRLTPPQLEAIVAHELSHIRRRDNLTAALHMLVEALFWFYPPVWWIGAWLVQERERACDEAVLSLGNKPGDYVDAILKVCKLYVESPLACVSGVTGPSINRRIRVILTQGLVPELPYGKKIALVLIGLAAVAAPIVLGMMNVRVAHAQPSASAAPPLQPAPAAQRNRRLSYLGIVTANTVVVTPRVDGQLLSVNFKEGGLVHRGQVLASIDAKPYRLQLEAARELLARDQQQLVAAAAQGSPEAGVAAQLKAAVEVDQVKVQIAKHQLSYAEVTAPITGIAGLHLVDAGNIVHSGDRLAIIAQLQPIAVRFNIQEDDLPKVVASLNAGSHPTVELFDRDGGKKKLAIGRLVAADNQIDSGSGTVALKAVFDNTDGGLFPNQFVIVRLHLDRQ